MHPRFVRSAVLVALRGQLAIGLLPLALPAQSYAFGAQTHSAAVPAQTRRLAELRRKVEADNRSNPVASVQWCEEALGLLAREPDAEAETWFLLKVTHDLSVLGDYPRASGYLDQVRRVVLRTGNQRDHFMVEVEAASLLSALEKHPETRALVETLLPAMEAYRRDYPRDTEIGRVQERGYRILASTCRDMGMLSEAVGALQKGQRVGEEVGDRRGHALILDQMGSLYVILGRLDEAVASHRTAIAMAEALGDLGLQASFHLSLANAYGFKDDTDRQLEELKIAAAQGRQAQSADTVLTSSVNMADVYLRKKDYKAALRHAEAALRMAQATRNASSIAVCQVNRGIALNRLGNSAEGLRALQEGLAHFVNAQALNDAAEITESLAEEYAFAGDFRRAYETQVQFKRLSDSLKKAKDQKHIAEASASFENDKKQIQIDALQRDRRNQAWLRLLWLAVGGLGFATAGVLVLSRRRLESANKALADMSLRDPLTSLANRRYLTTRIAEDLAQVHRLQRAGKNPASQERLVANIDVVFLMIDIDHFKLVNDQFGHVAGDQVLKQFAGILSRTMRDSDTVVRWGGEEFFVVAKHTSRADAHLVAERIRAQVEAFAFDVGTGEPLRKTCSVGYASYPFFRKDPSKVAWEKVAEVADQCLYAAKAMGRNTWVGVHEAEEAPEPLQEAITGYPMVSTLVEKGILRSEAYQDRKITWVG